MKAFSIKFLTFVILTQAAVFGQTFDLENLFKTRQYFDLCDELA